MNLRVFILSLFLTITNIGMAQVQFQASASKNKLGVNERLRVDFEMNQDGDNFVPPSFKGFTVIGGPNQAVSNSWINGKRTYSKTYSYFLSPTARGKFTIGQAEITIDGETYKTSPLPIEVTAAVDKPKDGNNSEFVASENLHLVAEISNSTPYLNEAITVVYKLYVSPRISVSNWREMDSPVYSDFWSQNIDIKQLKIETGEFEGEPYRYVILRKTILYPQKTGKLEIEPLTLSVSVEVPSERRDIFGGLLYTTVDKTVAAGKKVIDVKPLPENKPEGFTGAVGSFSFKVTADKKSLRATESLNVKVEASGKGNLKLFDLPKLQVPASLELYEPEHLENVRTDLSGSKGSIADNYTVVPNQEGKFPIPSLSFSYFDLDSKSYKTIRSEEILLNVESAPANAAFTGGNTPSGNKQVIGASQNQFRYIKLNANLQAIDAGSFFRSWKFWTLLLLPFVILGIGILFGKKREAISQDVTGNKLKKANKLARKYLSTAKKNLGQQKEFYIALERALHNYLKAKLNIQTSEMSKDRIRILLEKKGVDSATITEFNSLIESCEFARYTPSSNVGMQQDYDKAVRIISALDKEL